MTVRLAVWLINDTEEWDGQYFTLRHLENRGAGSLEDGAVLALRTDGLTDGLGEADLGVVESSGTNALAILGGDLSELHNLDVAEAGAVAASHIGVKVLGGVSSGDVTELLVDVVGVGTGVVLHPNAVVTGNSGALLEHLAALKELTVGTLELLELAHEVPETAASDNLVTGEDTHAEDRRNGLLIRGDTTANNSKLAHSIDVLALSYKKIVKKGR